MTGRELTSHEVRRLPAQLRWRRYWPHAAIALGWIVAAIALWLAGAWYGQMSRWDGCKVVVVGSENVYWECPSRKVRTPAPGENGGQNA